MTAAARRGPDPTAYPPFPSTAIDPTPAGRGLAGDALLVTFVTLLSRLTGFVRVLVAAAVLGNGLLGDTYHAANTVPNLLFELVAGGVLQAVLVPGFVAVLREHGERELGRATGAVLSVVTLALAGIAAVVMLVSPLITWALTSSGDQSAVADKREVMTPMLLVFIPQIVFYGIGMVTTAALAAKRRFVAAAIAPAVNNVVVITCLLAYRASRPGEEATLDLDPLQFAILAFGTTLGVIAFTAVPGVVLRAYGVRWRPHWDPRHPAVTSLRRAGGWAVLSVVGTLAPTAAAIVLGYQAVGGVAVFTMTFTFYVLPHALIAVPVATALAPRIADAWQQGRTGSARELLDRAVRLLLPPLLFAGAAMVALAWPVARVAASFGQAASQGLAPIAHALAVFGFGLVGYGVAFTMTRVLFSLGDVRAAAVLVTVSAVLGVAGMAIAAQVLADVDRASALAFGYGLAQTVSAVGLTLRVRRLTGAPGRSTALRLVGAGVLAALAAGGAMAMVQGAFDPTRGAAALAIGIAGAAGLVVFALVIRALAGVGWRSLVGGLRGG